MREWDTMKVLDEENVEYFQKMDNIGFLILGLLWILFTMVICINFIPTKLTPKQKKLFRRFKLRVNEKRSIVSLGSSKKANADYLEEHEKRLLIQRRHSLVVDNIQHVKETLSDQVERGLKPSFSKDSFYPYHLSNYDENYVRSYTKTQSSIYQEKFENEQSENDSYPPTPIPDISINGKRISSDIHRSC
ncbi:hypothetical protein SNEBB_008798 [Seison nebaliae]|nr:hypothetical protein SNEBB_008798 [Seison nebaliae]